VVEQAATSALTAFRRLAASLQRDDAAVNAGLTGPWSSGPVAGHIHRLKLLKRQMCGRAHVDLLGHRFVRMPCERETAVASARQVAQDEPCSLVDGQNLSNLINKLRTD